MQLNNSFNYESVQIVLSKDKTPIAFENRVLSLMNDGLNRDDAEKTAGEPIDVEMYYNPNAGLFLVECEAVECGNIYDPYTGELMEDETED